MKTMRILLWMFSALIGVLLLSLLQSAASGQSNSSIFMQEHAIPGAALNIVTEAPGQVWFTMPEANAIGSLVVSTTVTVTQYTIPTANSQPYDLAYANGGIWFTERTGNQIGRLDIATGTIQEYAIPTANSQPTGIAISSVVYIWFCTRSSNQVTRFNPTTISFEEYTFGTPGAQFEDLAVVNDDVVWVTAPSLNQVVFLDRLDQSNIFSPVDTAPYRGPTNIVLDEGTSGFKAPWVTLRDSGYLLRYAPGTLAIWRPYRIDTPNSAPTGIAYRNTGATWELWFAEAGSGKAGQLTVRTSTTPISLRDQTLPAGATQPWGVAVDANGHAWVAAGASNMIVEWKPPYFWFANLPTIRQQ
jgi:virginiamycin B lyase